MNVYEDKYLREKLNRIIAKQREGKVVIAAYKDGTGLPAREDLGDLGRAAYPYDYTVGSFGYLKYDSDLGAYLFTAKPDAKVPPVLAKYKRLTLAEAELDAATRVIQIRVGDILVTFSGAQPWKGLYEILREVNEDLLRTNAGIVVWKITKKETKSAALKDCLFPGAVPKLRNGQAMGYVSGYAYDSDRNLVYVGLVGYKTSLESLRVTLMAGKPISMTQDDAGDVSLQPVEKYEQVWDPMPEYTSHHAAFVARNALPGKWEPEDLSTYLLVFKGSTSPAHELQRLFVERLKEALEIPILNEWGGELWNQARDQRFVQKLTTGGDCLQGARIDLQADWKGLIAGLLQQETLKLTA
ncbi:MAG: hypothetical protein HY835_11270 [Anaerolineae bacterium]|nr:hypothetical protein [Anaerolineae bacterium]